MRPFPVHGSSGDEYVFLTPANLKAEKNRFVGPGYDKLSPLKADTVLGQLAADSAAQAKLRELWTLWHGRPPQQTTRTPRIVADLKTHVERGQLLLLLRVPPRPAQLVQQPPKVEPPRQPKPEPIECDWRMECEHHTKKGTRPFVHSEVLQVVPEKSDGKWIDAVKIHYKEKPKKTSVLYLDKKEIRPERTSGEYDIYPVPAEWVEDSHAIDFLIPRFWDLFSNPQLYQVSGGAHPFTVSVHNPHKYKFEFGLPPFRSSKIGAKLGEEGQFWEDESKKRMVKRGPTDSYNESRAGWSRSKLKVVSINTSASGDAAPKSKRKAEETSGGCSFTCDGKNVNIDVLKTLAKLVDLGRSFKEIRDSVVDLIPARVGWYFDVDFQVMQGKMAIEWYWKEFEDHTAFHYIDYNIALTILKLVVEFGFGLQGFRFKVQLFLQLIGSLDVSADGCIEDPRSAGAVTIPANAYFGAAIGVRVQAGNFLKAEGKGESGLKATVIIGINRLDRRRDPDHAKAFNFDLTLQWTGLKVSASFSYGAYGVGGSKSWEKVLMNPRDIWAGRWPEPQKFQAPDLSRDRIKAILLEKITDGFDVCVITPMVPVPIATPPGVVLSKKTYWDPEEIAEALTVVIEKHEGCSRTEHAIQGLAAAVRADFDVLSDRPWYVRDHITAQEFVEYLTKDSVRNLVMGLPAHLEGLIDPAQKMGQQLQAAK